MSRHGYRDDGWDDAEGQWQMIRWRGAVTSALRGKKGQAFLRELIAALDALPEKKLITRALVDHDGCACALGAVALARRMELPPMPDPDLEDYDLEEWWECNMPTFGIADALEKEIMYENDDGGRYGETPEMRWQRMRRWAERHLIEWDDEAASLRS